jgi:hypothetical protein
MKCIQAEFDASSKTATIKKDARQENWGDVCNRFNDDVSRVTAVGIKGYTALFECFDDANNRVYYLVNEDDALYKMKHRHFRKNLGLD